ncbi:DUF6340 family protein [Flavobacteriaceae bacterium F08102]|nr:DUF6340 family protein [Flavobacteriaceae bacterium F08102]
MNFSSKNSTILIYGSHVIKTHRKNLRLLLLVLLITLSSCAPTNELTIGVTKAAPLYLPKTVQRVGIMDRSAPSEENKTVDNLDKILSAEGLHLDIEGAQKAISGLSEALSNSQAFSKITIIENAGLRSPGLGIYPAVLSWETVKTICEKYQLDALYVLSYYDTDSTVDYTAFNKKVKGPAGVEIPVIEHQAKVNTNIKLGWRIYNLTNRRIEGQIPYARNVSVIGKGINPAKALSTLAGRKEAVLDASNTLAHQYGNLILPYKTRVKRIYFVKGTDNFKIGKRRAQAGQWNRAAELWIKETKNTESKIAGRAYYNMAIINEINGNLEEAIAMAQTAYTDYNNKEALKYINILKQRIINNQILAEDP